MPKNASGQSTSTKSMRPNSKMDQSFGRVLSLIRGRSCLIARNSCWSLGNGKSIDFWYDDWLSIIGPLRGWVQGPFSPEEESRKVHSIVNGGSWDLARLTIHLLSATLNRILHVTFIARPNPPLSHTSSHSGYCVLLYLS